ncbi:GNAT family N-acetyltransferase [Microbacterium azadirachtae]|uniref:GNAT family N-acetyltransferase n=1 Tax=Microbacterium azadirachtae TaxID=582680 RepID=UPI00088A9A53|nr:GNAT family protein [Microbacterium azadirachtae]SDM31560.1 Protein N-acetyltransferase, RimJ/RimL family [Microbacterium azadirachtae]SEG46439.1 Protein N-acetyltransferase, RimJ/RimL family [Microbacterium azadirachtae]SEG53133.1 Protein N-acetyltransferase, RimJ/RimL family [Microbacterium azadirachtae]
MEPVELRTPRLILHAPTSADVDAITTACQDPEIPRWTTVPSPYVRADAEDFVRLIGEWWEDGSETVWAAYADGELVASIGLHHIVDHPTGGDAELGYWVAAPARGRGYLTEAARAVIDWGFAELGLARIRWRAVVGNVPSARSARALGFRYEGLLRQGLAGPRGRDDGWSGALLRTDDRTPVDWPIDLG